MLFTNQTKLEGIKRLKKFKINLNMQCEVSQAPNVKTT